MPDNITPVTILMGNVLSIIMPRVGLVQVDANGLSRDPSVVSEYINDPLVYTGKTTARLGTEMLKTMQHVTEHAPKIKLPIMIVQGSDDKLVDPCGAELFFDVVSSEDKTIEMYQGFYYEVFNEPEHVQVLNDVKSWLNAHLGSHRRG